MAGSAPSPFAFAHQTPQAGTVLDLFATSAPPEREVSRAPPPPPARILDFLYLGSVDDVQNTEFTRQHNISTVINMSQERYWLSDTRIRVHQFDIADRADERIRPLFRSIIRLLTKARRRYYSHMPSAVDDSPSKEEAPSDEGEMHSDDGDTPPRRSSATTTPVDDVSNGAPPTILVHCQKGISRSVTAVCAYLMFTNGWSVAEALEWVQQRRPIAQPNMGFMDELHDFYRELDSQKGYDRGALRRQLLLCVRNVDKASDLHISAVLCRFGDVFRVERRETGTVNALCAVFFTSREGRRNAQSALVRDVTLRREMAHDHNEVAQLVKMSGVRPKPAT